MDGLGRANPVAARDFHEALPPRVFQRGYRGNVDWLGDRGGRRDCRDGWPEERVVSSSDFAYGGDIPPRAARDFDEQREFFPPFCDD